MNDSREEIKPHEVELPSEFRVWLMEKWFEHKDEIFVWEGKFPEYDHNYYFRKHKWMLRKMFQSQKKD